MQRLYPDFRRPMYCRFFKFKFKYKLFDCFLFTFFYHTINAFLYQTFNTLHIQLRCVRSGVVFFLLKFVEVWWRDRTWSTVTLLYKTMAWRLFDTKSLRRPMPPFLNVHIETKFSSILSILFLTYMLLMTYSLIIVHIKVVSMNDDNDSLEPFLLRNAPTLQWPKSLLP